MNKEILFNFLNDLRESGKINMFGAAPYLQEMFDLNRYEARDIVLEWMESFRNK
jgi:hypothetical protein